MLFERSLEGMKFDYLQIRTEAQYVKLNESKFDVTPGSETKHGFDIKRLSAKARNEIKNKFLIPSLRIKVCVIGPYLSLGITSKMLRENYLELITESTILTCLQSLIEYGILLEIDIESIMRDGMITVVEVTKDYVHSCLLTRRDYEAFGRAVSNPYRWSPVTWEGGFGLRKQVKENKEILTIYNKAQEVQMQRMQGFMTKYLPLNPFKDEKSIRIEGRLFTAKAVKKYFRGNKIADVLAYNGNVLETMLKKAFVNPSTLLEERAYQPTQKNLIFAENLKHDTNAIKRSIEKRDRHNRARIYRDVMRSVILSNRHDIASVRYLEEIINNI